MRLSISLCFLSIFKRTYLHKNYVFSFTDNKDSDRKIKNLLVSLTEVLVYIIISCFY